MFRNQDENKKYLFDLLDTSEVSEDTHVFKVKDEECQENFLLDIDTLKVKSLLRLDDEEANEVIEAVVESIFRMKHWKSTT